MLSHFSRVWDPMDCSHQGSPIHGISQTRILEWVAMPSSRGSSWPRDQTRVSYVSLLHWQGHALPVLPPGKTWLKNLPAMQETWVQCLGREDILEKVMSLNLSLPRCPATQHPPAIKGAPKGTQPLVPSIFPKLPGVASGQLWGKAGTKGGATGLPRTAKVPKFSLVQWMSRWAGSGEVYSHKAGNTLRLACYKDRC